MNKSPQAFYEPLITIIIAVYNAEKYLEQALLSVLNQTYHKIELIVIDGQSSDSTTEIIKKYSAQFKYWVSEKDNGIYDAWNKGLRHSDGEWICFLGADDFFLNESVLQTLVQNLPDPASEKTFVYGKVHQVSETNLTIIEVLGEKWESCKRDFDKLMTLAHAGSLHHKSLFQRNGVFNDTFRIAGDYELLLREFKTNPNFAYFVDIPVLAMRVGGISGTLNNRLRMANETNRARKINGFVRPSLPIILWIARIRFYLALRSLLGSKLSDHLADKYRSLTGKNKRWSI